MIADATTTPKSIALCMVVKDAAPAIRRCLDSALPLIDHLLVIDAGSRDGTQDTVRDWLRERNIPGQVIEARPADPAQARSLALETLRQIRHIDYALMLDPDMVVNAEPGFDARQFKTRLAADSYDFACQAGATVFWRPHLLSNRLPFRYHLPALSTGGAPLREFLDCPRPYEIRRAQGFSIAMGRAQPIDRSSAAASDADFAERASSIDTTGAPREKRIGLCMIVKNEAHVIRRCLDSILPLIDYVSITDTGSRDGTQEVIRIWLREKNVRGEVVEEPWRDFAYNRTFAIERLRRRAGIDYALMVDADEIVEFEPDFDIRAFKRQLSADVYGITMRHGETIYWRPQLFRNELPFRFKAVLHEYLECPEGHSSARAAGFHIRLIQDSARNKNPRKYQDDAMVLEKALAGETDPFLIARYTFYLAQSYKDAGDRARALENYAKRTKLGFWDQEIYISLLNMGDLKQSFGLPAEEILADYRQAIKLCPDRAEAYHAASRYLRGLKRFAEGFEIAKPAIDLPLPSDALFLAPWIYRHGLLDEYSVNAYWADRFEECLQACQRILALPDLEAAMRERVAKNADFARAKLAERAIAGKPRPDGNAGNHAVSSWAPGRPRAGTEILFEGLTKRLGGQLDGIDFRLNMFSVDDLTGKPLVVWFHHNVDQQWVQWCKEPSLVGRVHRFVFVSHWQKDHYVRTFGLARERCVVLRNAVDVAPTPRPWQPGKTRRLAYTSTPFRGLSVLLDAWDRLRPRDAELHIWSSMKLYGDSMDDREYAPLFERARTLPNVFHRGIVPNEQLLAELRTIDFLAYPSTFEETSCLSVLEAMAAGCRIICPALAALPETTAGFARLYPVQADHASHVATFAEILGAELANPWQGMTDLSLSQQGYCRAVYDWSARVPEWSEFLAGIGGQPAKG